MKKIRYGASPAVPSKEKKEKKLASNKTQNQGPVWFLFVKV
jgi:hypothetical protein